MPAHVKRYKQKGAALIVSLVLLVVALLLSLSAMQSSRLEESMAGNYRASERALMAAEYGAAAIAKAVLEKNPEGDSFGGIMDNVAAAVESFQISNPVAGKYYRVSQEDNSYFSFQIDSSALVEEDLVRVISVGEVFSGAPGEGGKVVASRSLVFDIDVDLGYPSPVSMMCPQEFRMPSSPSGVEGEDEGVHEVEGVVKYRPAISAGSLENAAKVTADILNTNIAEGTWPDEITGSNPNYTATLIDEDTYHATPVVDEENNVDYSRECKISNNPMCGILGGVSSKEGAPPLRSAFTFHAFVDAIFQAGMDGHENVVMHDALMEYPENAVVDNKINIFTSGEHFVYSSGDYSSAGDLAGNPLFFDEGDNIRGEGGGEALFNLVAGNIEDDVVPYEEDGGTDLSSSLVLSGYGFSGLSFGETKYFPTNTPFLDFYSGEGGVLEDGSMILNYDEYYSQNADGDEVLNVNDQPSFEAHGRPVTVDFGNSFSTSPVEVSDGGSESVGSTLIIVDGNIKVGTRPQIHGMLIALGDYTAYGGGSKDNSFVRGSIISAPYYFDRDPGDDDYFVCQDSVYDVDGAGNFKVYFDGPRLKKALSLLPDEALLRWLAGNDVKAVISAWTESLVN